jgi:hypothetical protein
VSFKASEDLGYDARPFLSFAPLFTRVRGIGILRTSPFGISANFAKKSVINTAIE